MNIPIKATCFFILCSVCYESFSHDNVASTDFAELEETVRNNTGDIEELKRQIAELKEQIDQLLGQGSFGDTLFKQGKYDEAEKLLNRRGIPRGRGSDTRGLSARKRRRYTYV